MTSLNVAHVVINLSCLASDVRKICVRRVVQRDKREISENFDIFEEAEGAVRKMAKNCVAISKHLKKKEN